MEYVQKVKGTKVVVTLFSQNVGDDLPDKEIYHEAGTSSDPEKVRPAIKPMQRIFIKLVLNVDMMVMTGIMTWWWNGSWSALVK